MSRSSHAAATTFLAVAATLCFACSSDDTDDAGAVDGAATTAPPAPVDGGAPETTATSSSTASSSSTTAPTQGVSAPSTAATTSTTTAPDYPSAAAELGLPEIEQLTATDGGGRRPVLEWVPVDGAAQYYVFVLSPSDAVYWGWETSEPSVPVGGEPQLDDDAPGPAISEGMTWSVSAADAEGAIIALSAHRPISP